MCLYVGKKKWSHWDKIEVSVRINEGMFNFLCPIMMRQHVLDDDMSALWTLHEA